MPVGWLAGMACLGNMAFNYGQSYKLDTRSDYDEKKQTNAILHNCCNEVLRDNAALGTQGIRLHGKRLNAICMIQEIPGMAVEYKYNWTRK